MFKIEGDKTLAEPFAEEAKYFTEVRLLQRDVKIVLEGASNQNLLGTVLHPVSILDSFRLVSYCVRNTGVFSCLVKVVDFDSVIEIRVSLLQHQTCSLVTYNLCMRYIGVTKWVECFGSWFSFNVPHLYPCSEVLRGYRGGSPTAVRPSDPALCGSCTLVTPYNCRLGDLLCLFCVYRFVCALLSTYICI